MANARQTIGAVAAIAKCHVETIRYYEKEGLLPRPERTEGGRRLYTPVLVARLVFIRRSRELGFTMDEIRQLLSLVDKAEAKTCDAVKEIAETHLKEVQTRIADLQLIERTLLQLTVQCPGGTTQVCPIVESLQAS